jgi:hypothetical protein
MRPLELSTELAELLERVKKHGLFLPVLGFRQEKVWEMARPAIRPLMDSSGLNLMTRNQYRSFCRELTSLCRQEQGLGLAQGVRTTIRKWRDLGLDFKLVQDLALACWHAFEAFDPSLQPEDARQPDKQHHRTHRGYEEAVESGDVPTPAETWKPSQFRSYREAMEHNRDISIKVRQLLIDYQYPLRDFIRYNAFAFRLDRAARRYTRRSLNMAASNFVDEWEEKGLDRDMLLAICFELFHITPDHTPPAG